MIEMITSTLILGCKNSKIPNKVTLIGSYAFQDFSGLTGELKIPDRVRIIKEYAFYNCSGLTSVTIGSGVISIEENAFSGCSGLENIVVDANNLKYSSQDGILYNKAKTEFILIPQAIKGSVTIPNSMTSIRGGAFWNRSGLTSITIPDSVTSIGSSAFEGCSGLTSIEIPNSVTSIGNDVFKYCSGLESITVDANNPNYSCQGGILYNKAKTKIVYVPEAIKGSVTIPDSVTAIEDDSFRGCIGLTSIEIPDSVTSIGDDAFYGCYKLIEVWNYSELELQPGSSDNGYVARYAKHVYTTDEESKQTVTEDGCIFYEDGDENYLLGYTGTETTLTLPATSPKGKSYEIYQYAFYENEKLTSIIIPDGVNSIRDYVFYNCSGLERVTIGNGVTSIGSHAFYGCSGLTDITIPDSVISIESGAFEGCSGLEHISVAVGNQKYHSEGECLIETDTNTLILGCKNSKIPDSVTEIGWSAFEDCEGLTSIVIPDGVTTIWNGAFSGCSGLTNIVIPDSVTTIWHTAFSVCSKLADIQFKGTVEAWQAIVKGISWNNGTPDYTITCTDGTIAKDGTVTYFNN